jgi:outer membrane protein assembly factor BamB
MKTGFQSRMNSHLLILGLAFLIISLSCSFLTKGNDNNPSSTQTSNEEQTPNNEEAPITTVDEPKAVWKKVIWNTAPSGFEPYPKTWLNSGLVPPLFTVFPSVSANDVAIFPPISPTLSASHFGGLNFKIYRSYFVSEDSIYTLNENLQALKLNLKNGDEQWKSNIQGSLIGIDDKKVYINRDDNRLFALDNKTGNENWYVIFASLVSSGTNIFPSSEIIPYSGLIIIPVNAGTNPNNSVPFGMVALEQNSGKTVWTSFNERQKVLLLKDGVILSQFANGSCDLAYLGTNATDGNVAWSSSHTAFGREACLNIEYFDPSQGVLVYAYLDTDSYHHIAIDVVTGQHIWAQDLLTPRASPVLELKEITNSHAIFSSTNKIVVFDIPSGNIVSEIGGDRPFSSYIGKNNIAVISFPELGVTQGIDLSSQAVLWENPDLKLATNSAEAFPSFVIGDILITIDKATYETLALSITDGKQLWNKRLIGNELVGAFDNIASEVFFNEFCKAYNGLLYCVDIDTLQLFAIDPSTGNTLMQVGSTSGFPMSIQHVEDDYWLVQSFAGDYFAGELALMKLIRR